MLSLWLLVAYGMVSCAQAVHKVMRMAVLCKQNGDPVHATNLHAVITAITPFCPCYHFSL